MPTAYSNAVICERGISLLDSGENEREQVALPLTHHRSSFGNTKV